MPRTVSAAARASMNAQHTSEAWLTRMVIDHPDLAEPIRVIRDNQNHTIDGDLWVSFDFDVPLPDSVTEEQPRVRLRIQNVDRMIVSTLRALPADEPPTVTVEVVLASSLDVVEIGPLEFTLTQGVYGATDVLCDLAFEDIVNLIFTENFNPIDFPGAFA